MKTLRDIFRNTRRAFLNMQDHDGYGRYWHKAFLPRIGKALMKAKGGKRYETYGPMGLMSECAVCVWDADGKAWHLTFRPDCMWTVPSKMRLSLIDWSTDTGEYKPGTIGYVNLMNNPSVNLDPSITIEELAGRMLLQEHDGTT